MNPNSPVETTVIENGVVAIPAAVRREVDIEPGDKIAWRVNETGELQVEVIKQEYGAFDDFEPVPMGGDGHENPD